MGSWLRDRIRPDTTAVAAAIGRAFDRANCDPVGLTLVRHCHVVSEQIAVGSAWQVEVASSPRINPIPSGCDEDRG